MATRIFRPLRARKGKFGFEASINSLSFILISEAVQRAKRVDENLKFEVDLNYGKGLVKVYTDVEAAAEELGFVNYPE
jgi:hypothetical protein